MKIRSSRIRKILPVLIVPLVLVLVALVSLYFWLSDDPAANIMPRLPSRDLASEPEAGASLPAQQSGQLIHFNTVAANTPGAWPRFRGSTFDGISTEKIPLARSWPDAGPKILWSVELGEGHAGAAVLAGKVYVIDYDRSRQADAIRCFSLADGNEIWRYSYPVKIKRNHGMSRTVPAVTDRYIVTLGPKCHVTCLDAETGAFLWMIDLVKQFKTKVPPWYAGQCPLIDNAKAIISPGGRALMIAVDCATGDIIWETGNPFGWDMTHSSIIPVDFAGRRMYLYCASGGVIAVSAGDGKIVWHSSDWKIRIAAIPSPVPISQGRIFFSGGYNAGAMMIQLTEENGRIQHRKLFKLEADVFGSPQHTPIFYNGYIYGVRPDGQLVCLDEQGRILWTSSGANKFGLGPYVLADGMIYIMNDSGLLSVVEARPDRYVQLAQAKVLEGPDSWGPMAVAGTRLILRDLNKMICLDIAAP
ncbi:MAG: PQQ-binding-like beta-propeller repeat protein [Planctomycetota bacterium]